MTFKNNIAAGLAWKNNTAWLNLIVFTFFFTEMSLILNACT